MNNALLKNYNQMLSAFGTRREMTSYICPLKFKNANECCLNGTMLFNETSSEITRARLDNEVHFHSFLLNQLFSKLQEIKAYSIVNINNTRRLIAVSQDCISTIHVLVRDEIQVNVYFRSSDYDGALPVDLKFISEIPTKLIKHMIKFKGTKGYEEVTQELIEEYENKPVLMNLMFGSLHRTNKGI